MSELGRITSGYEKRFRASATGPDDEIKIYQLKQLSAIQNTLKLIAFILGIIATVAFMLWLAKVD